MQPLLSNHNEIVLLQICQESSANMFDKASAMHTLCSKYGYTQSSLSKQLGISQSAVANKIRLLQYNIHERSLILSAHLTERHARALLRAAPMQRISLIHTVTEMQLTVKQTDELIDQHNTNYSFTEKLAGPTVLQINSIHSAEFFTRQILHSADLLRNAGHKVTCLTESGEGWQRITVTILDESFT